jgi:prepilin signal peptidase PulO-like enzyme (type II secretory pathway)
VLGLCAGSFVNVLALRSLKEESLIKPGSYCPTCQHSLAPIDLIPLFSYLALGGRCRYCQAKISWQYPVVEFATACSFTVIGIILRNNFLPYLLDSSGNAFSLPALWLGLLVLTVIFMAVTVTDFKEKLIPHEITYPSIVLGLLFSWQVRHDLLGSLVGVGVSYLLFDYIAFYGLKFYLYLHPELAGENREEEEEEEEEEKNDEVRQAGTTGKTGALKYLDDPQINKTFGLPDKALIKCTVTAQEQNLEAKKEEQPFFGDPVVAAIVAAFLGLKWQLLAIALGFLAGLKKVPTLNLDLLYPLVIIGLATSYFHRQDLSGALAAVGVCYIVFDFFALYKEKHRLAKLSQETVPLADITNPALELDPRDYDDFIDREFDLQQEKPLLPDGDNDEAPLEVMGGGDAVLAALIAAWMGWEKLIMAVILAFIVGAIMGLVYLLIELKQEGLLKHILKPALVAFLIFSAVPLALVGLAAYLTHYNEILTSPAIWMLSPIFGIAGALLNLTSRGLKLTKTFPFGPALVIGAFAALASANGGEFDSFLK